MKTRFFTLLVAIAVLFGADSKARAASPQNSEQVLKLLSQARVDAAQLMEDASTLESYTTDTRISWQAHADAVAQMRAHINALGQLVTELDNARSGAEPWEQTAIDRIRPLLRELAANTTAVINRLNNHPGSLNMGDYRNYVEANSDDAQQLSALVSEFVDYGKTKNRLDNLTAKLELPAAR